MTPALADIADTLTDQTHYEPRPAIESENQPTPSPLSRWERHVERNWEKLNPQESRDSRVWINSDYENQRSIDDPLTLGYFQDVEREAELDAELLRRIKERARNLANEAEQDGVILNLESEGDLSRFWRLLTRPQEPELYLRDNGDFLAVWGGRGRPKISVEFLGGWRVQYVMISEERDGVSSSSGVADPKKVLGIAHEFGADSVIFRV